jgi:predicted O-linked N-acetylglucosamine transferase (SPINDLY family)
MNDHLARYALADLFLDTIPYNAHTTSVDCLKAGVPVITCIGSSFAGRVGASLLNAINLPELITTSISEYEKLAITLATQPHQTADLKQKIAANMLTAPLFNTSLFAKHLEAAYIEMMRRYWEELPPEHIYIES